MNIYLSKILWIQKYEQNTPETERVFLSIKKYPNLRTQYFLFFFHSIYDHIQYVVTFIYIPTSIFIRCNIGIHEYVKCT